jgi:hypothetical protein
MLSPMEIAGVSLFVLAVASAFAWNVYYPRFLSRVQSVDASAWQQLGQPQNRWYGYRPTWSLLKYLWTGAYESLSDASAIGLARRARISLRLVGIGVIGAFGLLTLSKGIGA